MHITKSILAISLLGAFSLGAHAVPYTTINDGYVGADDNGWGDVIGNTDFFQINSMDVWLDGSMLNVSIDTTFAGRGDDGLFSGHTAGSTGIGYGDLFLSSSWNPYGSAPYYDDDSSNGTVWEYGFSLDDRWMGEADSGTGILYSLNSGDNSDILMSDDFMTGAIYRNGQEVAVDTVDGDITAVGDGSWGIDTGTSTVNFLIDLSGTNLALDDEIALRWEFTCANDVIEGAYGVPEPGIMLLLSTGIAGMLVTRRRKT